ncbi:MAG TPA: polymer-forming cytoskeletal protein [Casimicrobiaceae bacterium]|jgi:cytoskeletal protein CcmA (bactofilin family)
MLNFERGKTPANPKDPGKPGLKPALYDPPASSTSAGAASSPPRAPLGNPAPPPTAAPQARDPAPAASASSTSTAAAAAESRLCVGVNIKLKGVEISDCDVVVIEGHVEATVNSKTMEIAEPGTYKGTALIDVAEIRGDFTGELTARTRLVVHGTGKVSGTIRYGKLIVEEGGEISGDMQRITEGQAQAKSAPAPDLRLGLGHATAGGLS